MAVALIAGGVVVVVSTMALHLDAPPANPALFLLLLVAGMLAGLVVLGNAAARAASERRTAKLVVIPAAIVWAVLLAASLTLIGYAVDLVMHGVPLRTDAIPGNGDTASVHVYSIDALPAGHAAMVPALVGALAACFAACIGAMYATLGAIRGLRTPVTSG
jgi:hypothetical protein